MPKRYAFLFLSIIMFLGCSSDQPRYIVVDGRATTRVPIDYIDLNITIQTRDDNLLGAERKNKSLVVKMFDLFKHFGIADSDFVTVRSETQREYDYRTGNQGKPSILYSGTLTLRQPKLYDQVFRSLVSLGDLSISIADYGSYKADSIAKSTYTAAVAAARSQALVMLSGSGQKPGKLLKLLQEGRDPFAEYDDIDKLARRSPPPAAIAALADVELAPVTFRKEYFEHSAHVTAIFEIN